MQVARHSKSRRNRATAMAGGRISRTVVTWFPTRCAQSADGLDHTRRNSRGGIGAMGCRLVTANSAVPGSAMHLPLEELRASADRPVEPEATRGRRPMPPPPFAVRRKGRTPISSAPLRVRPRRQQSRRRRRSHNPGRSVRRPSHRDRAPPSLRAWSCPSPSTSGSSRPDTA